MTNKVLEAKRKVLVAESRVRDLFDANSKLLAERKDLERINTDLQRARMTMYDSFIIERNELLTRIQRIDARVSNMGLPVPQPQTLSKPL